MWEWFVPPIYCDLGEVLGIAFMLLIAALVDAVVVWFARQWWQIAVELLCQVLYCCCVKVAWRGGCVILLSFAAGHRKSYWSGCINAAILICQQIFSILALAIFLLKLLLKSASKSSFSCFGVEIQFWSRNFCAKASLCESFPDSAKAFVCTSFCV